MAQIKHVYRKTINFGYGADDITGPHMVVAEDDGDVYDLWVETTTGPRSLRVGMASPRMGSWGPIGSVNGDKVLRFHPENEDVVIWLEAARPDGSWEVISGAEGSLTEIALAQDLKSAGFRWAFQSTKVNCRTV
jgi:hypothetical protein